MKSFLFNENYKGHFSGHETFPLRQLWLSKSYKAVTQYSEIAPKNIFTDNDAIVRFGVGKNMVASIRHWAIACNIVKYVDGGYQSTRLGEMLLNNNGLDPYGEHNSTPWLIHWILTGRGKNRAVRSTTWAWLFNYVTQASFEKKNIYDSLIKYIKDKEQNISHKSIQTDIDVCFRSYIPKVSKSSPEDTSEPILADLGLLISDAKNSFCFRRGTKTTLHSGLFAFALLEFWDEYSLGINTLSFDSIVHDYGSPGRVFKLDENSIADYIIDLESITNGKIIWSDSAGIRQVIRKDGYPDKYKLLELAYE
ncbi:MAG: DUF4007 family protein [Gammaproteobacteria bacterium]|nr:DUF4007 family protein [Gammaproteobacteria bacterium]